jgi:hypothetical protein
VPVALPPLTLCDRFAVSNSITLFAVTFVGAMLLSSTDYQRTYDDESIRRIRVAWNAA